MDEEMPRSRMRAADSDREQVAEQLRSAHAEGRLDLAEYDERIQQAWAARTYGELERLTADLPQRRRPAAAERRAEVRQPHLQHRHGHGGRAAVTVWVTVSLVNVVIWALVCLFAMGWVYPWWIWVAGPWGAALLTSWAGERARSAKPPR